MTKKRLVAMRFDLDIIEGLEQLREKTGAPLAETVRRAIRAWLASQGVELKPKPERKRVAPRKRS